MLKKTNIKSLVDKESVASFVEGFKLLTTYDPYPWQIHLFERFLDNDISRHCSIPTGLGKTAVIFIWLLALAWQGMKGEAILPRRLVYIVNRRTVVDQATTLAEVLAKKLADTRIEFLKQVSITLDNLAAFSGPPIAVSTLRGQYADNQQWKKDPAIPAVIIGTVDMVGSKLLFKGYGDSRWKRPFHAGLLGHDSLFVHDEGHLSPAFGDLLRGVAKLEKK